MNMNYLALIIIIVILLPYIVYIIRYRITHRFWSKQPVFHYYQYWNWLFPKGIVYSSQRNIPFLERYYEDNRVIIREINEDNQEEILKNDILYDKYCSLVKNHYIGLYDKTEYNPSKTDIHDYLMHHNNNCYYGLFNDYGILINNVAHNKVAHNNINLHNSIVSGLISRPLIVTFFDKYKYLNGKYLNRTNNNKANNNNNNKELIKFKTNYVDFLCTHPTKRRKNITPKLIYSFAYKTINLMKNHNKDALMTPTFLFKKEYDLTPFVPFISFYSYTFDTTYWSYFDIIDKENHPLMNHSLTMINQSNISLFTNNFDKLIHKSNINTTIVPCISHLISLFNKKHIYCFILHYKENIHSIYFFKNSNVSYQQCSIIEFIGSLSYNLNNSFNKNLFCKGFICCLINLKKNNTFKDKPLKYIIIENISCNNIILKYIKIKYRELQKHHSAYYFYNIIEVPRKSNMSLILC